MGDEARHLRASREGREKSERVARNPSVTSMSTTRRLYRSCKLRVPNMKKFIVSIAIPMTVSLLAFTFAVPSSTQAQTVTDLY